MNAATVEAVIDRFRSHELNQRASALAFQMLTAVVPFALFTVALLGFLGLAGVYESELRPALREDLSIPAFSVVDDSINQVLTEKKALWLTIGLALAIYQLSGVVRAAGSTLDKLYGTRKRDPYRERWPRSLLTAAAVAALMAAAILVAAVAPLLYGDVGPVLGALFWLLRYALAGALLIAAVGIVVHTAPSRPKPVAWVSTGAVLVTVCWLAVTAAFGAYMSAIASYGSIYGAFASVVVLLAWMYASAYAFLIGLVVDDVLRRET